MDFLNDLFGGGGQSDNQTVVQNDIRKLPDYKEAEGARGMWYDSLTEWGDQPGYGAIAPNWSDIWENARMKVQRHFSGGPEGPGLNAKVKARAAARGMSENPAADTMLQRSGFQEGNMLYDMAVKQAMEEANFAEAGRQTWLGSTQNLAGLKPSFSNYGSTTTREYAQPNPAAQGIQGLLGNMAGTGSTGFDSLDSIMDMFGGGSGIGDPDSEEGGGDMDWLASALGFAASPAGQGAIASTGGAIASLAGMFCWVASEIFGGMDHPKTVACRYYIGEIGPKWFKVFYMKHGERIAGFIKDKPLLKLAFRPMFEVFALIGRASMQEKIAYGL